MIWPSFCLHDVNHEFFSDVVGTTSPKKYDKRHRYASQLTLRPDVREQEVFVRASKISVMTKHV